MLDIITCVINTKQGNIHKHLLGAGNVKLLTVKIVLKFLEIHCVSDVYVGVFINFYLFNFAIIIHAWQGHHNSITPITVGLLNIIKIQHKTEIKHNRNLEKYDIKTTLKAKGGIHQSRFCA